VRLSAIAAVGVVSTVLACSDATSSGNPTQATQINVGPGNSFNPKNVTVSQGDTVIWVFSGGGHDVTFATSGAPAGCVSLCVRTFPTKGTFNYYCTPHAGLGMVGSVTVQ